jgi:hypothetical protein
MWLPVIENDFNQTKFLSRSPFEILRDNPGNNFKDVQIMIGITAHEMIYAAPCKIFLNLKNFFRLFKF